MYPATGAYQGKVFNTMINRGAPATGETWQKKDLNYFTASEYAIVLSQRENK